MFTGLVLKSIQMSLAGNEVAQHWPRWPRCRWSFSAGSAGSGPQNHFCRCSFHACENRSWLLHPAQLFKYPARRCRVTSYKCICNARNHGSELWRWRKRDREIESSRSPERRRLWLQPPSQEQAAPFNPRRFSNNLPAAVTGEGERRKMDKITADIKAALKCARGRKMVSAARAIFFPVLSHLCWTGIKRRNTKCCQQSRRGTWTQICWFCLVWRPVVYLTTFFLGHLKVTGKFSQALN